MTPPIPKLLFWSPRILCMLLAAGVAVFALDVFEAGYSFTQLLLALFMHLLPALFIVAVLILAWRREWIGAVAYLTLGTAYAVMAWNKFPEAVLILSGASWLTGILFAWNALWKQQRPARAGKRS